MPIQLIQSDTVFQGRVFKVRKDLLRLEDGRQVIMDVVDHAAAVTLVPMDEAGRVWFVRQYRHPAGKELLELPAGVVDEGEMPEEAAHREIREEIGMAAGHLEPLGGFFLAPGYSTEYMHVFLATQLSPDPLEMDEDEVILVEKYPAEQVWDLEGLPDISDSKTLLALVLAQKYLQKKKDSI